MSGKYEMSERQMTKGNVLGIKPSICPHFLLQSS